LFLALLALALFDPGAATAQQVKQIKLTEKHMTLRNSTMAAPPSVAGFQKRLKWQECWLSS
jgi:hypothetical protein